MKEQLSSSDKRIIARNEEEIKFLQIRLAQIMKDIEALEKQNRELKGRE